MPPIFENHVLSDDDEIPAPKAKKDGRKSRPMTEERRAQLLENLKKGRATSAAKRGKKASVKNILKKKSDEFQERIINKELGEVDELQTLRNELKLLRETIGKNKPLADIAEAAAPEPVYKPPKPTMSAYDLENETYRNAFASGGRPSFSASDIIKDQVDYKRSRKYTGSINSRFLNF
mgnify:CR=1 FL=1